MFAGADQIARALAIPLNLGIVPVEAFRRVFFKGKLAISHHFRRYPANGLFDCDGLRFDLDLSDDIQKAIYLNLYEWRDLRAVRPLIEPGQTIVDLGANMGFYTLQFARSVGPAGHVHAFEPLERNRAKLFRNVALNGFEDRVTINPEAVSERTGTADFLRLRPQLGLGADRRRRDDSPDRLPRRLSRSTRHRARAFPQMRYRGP